jgi:hypothetical protein
VCTAATEASAAHGHATTEAATAHATTEPATAHATMKASAATVETTTAATAVSAESQCRRCRGQRNRQTGNSDCSIFSHNVSSITGTRIDIWELQAFQTPL